MSDDLPFAPFVQAWSTPRVDEMYRENLRAFTPWVPVTPQVLLDAPPVDRMQDVMHYTLRRAWFPWEYSDRNPMPSIDLVPPVVRRIERSARDWLKEWSWRLHTAGHALRGERYVP